MYRDDDGSGPYFAGDAACRLAAHWCLPAAHQSAFLLQIFTQFANQLGGLFYIRVLHVPMVIVADPALWQAALAPGTDLPKAPTVYGTIDQVVHELLRCVPVTVAGRRKLG
jgi:hypothetical protein